jgi:putative transposase
MPNYRRILIKGGIYFLTLTTHQRQELFSEPKTKQLFLESLQHVKTYHPFAILAYCILPDHIHLLIKLPESDSNYSLRIGEAKKHFSKRLKADEKYNSAQIWQNRFWEHYIRDDIDLSRHIDYIHYNPVKHNLVGQANEWSSSSFTDYVRKGYYDRDWGQGENAEKNKFNYGE